MTIHTAFPCWSPPRPLPLHFVKSPPTSMQYSTGKGLRASKLMKAGKAMCSTCSRNEKAWENTWMMDGLNDMVGTNKINGGNCSWKFSITSNVKIYVRYCQNLWIGGATASFWNKKLPSRATGHLRLLGSLGNPSKRQRTIGILQKLE